MAPPGVRLFNSASRQIEPFVPLVPGQAGIYDCGPTVYDWQTIGNLYRYIVSDVQRRTLEYLGYRVKSVMNITDVGHIAGDVDEGEDRMMIAAKREGRDPETLARKYTDQFMADRHKLNILDPHVMPKATAHIPEMIELIKRLIAKGNAYAAADGVYFDISTFPEYGKRLAGELTADLVAGARVDVNPNKRNPADFALWRAKKPGDLQFWDSPWGQGNPGWHIECSAMSMKYLGETFDIHAGGIDLVFPHHENEIAQSEGATGKQFVRYWIHFEHLKVDGETMSKSKGNYYTFRDVVEKGYSAAAIRYFLLSVPHNKQLNFTFDALAGAERTVASLRDFRARLSEAKTEPGSNDELREAAARALNEFEAGMDDDFNTSIALAAIHNLSRDVNTALARKRVKEENKKELLELLTRFDSVLNVLGDQRTEMLDSQVQAMIDERQEARRRRDFARADEIRVELANRGIILEDTKDGVRWKRK